MSANASDRERALADIAALVERHGLSLDDVQRALAGGGPPSRARAILGQVLAYLGGTFVLAGVGAFVATSWDELGSAARITVTLGAGLAALVLAHVAERDPRRHKLVTPLWLLAAVLQPAGLLVAFSEYSTGGDPLVAQLVVSAVLLVQGLLVLARVRRTAVLFTTLFYGAVAMATAFELLDVDEELYGFLTGLATLCATRAIQRTRHAAIAPFWYAVGAGALLVCAYGLVDGSPFEVLYVALAVGVVYCSTLFASRTLLAAGTLGVLAYIGVFTAENFADSLGWPLVLVVLGLALMGLSSAAIRINRRYIDRDARA